MIRRWLLAALPLAAPRDEQRTQLHWPLSDPERLETKVEDVNRVRVIEHTV